VSGTWRDPSRGPGVALPWNCKGNPAVLMMHGQLDGAVTAANPMGRWIPFADAKLTRDAWVSRNGCGTTTTQMVNQFPAWARAQVCEGHQAPHATPQAETSAPRGAIVSACRPIDCLLAEGESDGWGYAAIELPGAADKALPFRNVALHGL
jgi:hypothetical protein